MKASLTAIMRGAVESIDGKAREGTGRERGSTPRPSTNFACSCTPMCEDEQCYSCHCGRPYFGSAAIPAPGPGLAEALLPGVWSPNLNRILGKEIQGYADLN